MARFAQRAAAAVAAILICAATAFAQVDRATLTGVVKDPTDAVLRGAKVTITSLATGVSSTVTTSNEGVYLVLNLPSGEYLVQAEATGFQRFEQTVSLELGARSRLDMSLAVGSIGETVKVEGVTPLLSTESAVLGTVVDKNEMDKLPLAIRNWDDLLAMVPGVQSDRYTEQAGGTSAGRTGGVSVHGNRSLQNNFLLDGVANNSFSTNVQELTTQLSRPSVDAIEEFKVVTSPYAAEYGWSPGAAIIVSTKSGSNRFRGTAYDFFRNDSMDTINYFAKAANQPKATNKQNQFGGNVGGPLMRNRAFFFADYEGTRLEQGVLRTGNVMTADQRRGVFTTSIRDPLTGQPFPNNTIPTNRIDPVAAAIMQMVPLPNATGANNFIRQPNVEDTSDRYLVRTDVPIGNSNNLFVRYIGSNRVRFVPGWFGGVLDGTSTSAWGRNFLDSHAVVGGWNKVLGSSLVNESRVSYARGTNDGKQDPFGQSGMEQIGFKGVPNDPTVAGGIVGVDIDGHIRLGSPNFMPKFQHTSQVQWMNTTTWMRGSHQIKFGVDLMMPMTNEYFDVAPTRGNLRFQATFTGNAFADFLIGYPNRAELTNVFVVTQELWSSSFYVQDDWKPTDKLTLNLGLRYDFMPPATEKDNRLANFDPNGNGGRGRAGVRQRRIARRSRARQPGQEQLRAARRRDLPHQRTDAPSRRLRGVLQPVRSHRLRGSAGAQSAGAAQHPGQLDGQHQPGVPDEGRVPAELSRSLEPGDPQPEAARRDPGWTANDGPAVWRGYRTRGGPQHGGVGRRGRLVHVTPCGAAQPQSAAPRHARCQWRHSVSGFRQHPGARDERRSQL